jgi:adenylate cyclase
LAAIEASRKIIDANIKLRGGKIIQTAGDSVIARFPGAVDSVSAAIAIQHELSDSSTDVFAFRIGQHFGDVNVTDKDVLGDGLNIAARLEPLAPTGGICISGVVADQIVGKIDSRFASIGRRKLKNIERPIEVFCWPEKAARDVRRRHAMRRWPTVTSAVIAVAAVSLGIFLFYRDPTPSMPTGPRIAVLPFDEVGTPKNEAVLEKD